jgi:hypothetical protein
MLLFRNRKVIKGKGKIMLKQIASESRRIDFQASAKTLLSIFQLVGKNTNTKGTKIGLADGTEDRHFLPMLKAGLAALDAKEEKTMAVSETHDITENTGKVSDVGKGEKIERKHEMDNETRSSEERIDECQVDGTENPSGLQSNNCLKADNDDTQNSLVEVVPEDSGEDIAAGLQRLIRGTVTQANDINSIVRNALLEKGVDENDIKKILAVINEGELRSVPLEGQIGEATVDQDSGAVMLNEIQSDSENVKIAVPKSLLAALREKGLDEKEINNILAVIKEGEVKPAPLERQVGEVIIEKDSRAGMLKGMPSDSNPEMGNSSGDSPAFSAKGKVTVPESFTLAGQADLTVYGSDSKIIRSGNAKPLEDHLLVSQIASQLPSGVDKGSGRVKITLYPEHLGSLDMDIIFRENKVQVVLMAEHPNVRQELQNREGQLRYALQEQGVQVDGIDFLLRQSSQEMDGGSGGSHLWWRENSGRVNEVGKEPDMPVSSAISLLVTGKTGGTMEGGISLFV